MRAVSQLVSTIIIVGLVIGASVFVSWVLINTLKIFHPSTVMSFSSGRAYIDPSDQTTVVGEVMVTITGGERVSILSVRVVYKDKNYQATCLNCDEEITANYPNSGNDFAYIRFYFKPDSPPAIGDKFEVIIEYRAGSETRYASGTLTISEYRVRSIS